MYWSFPPPVSSKNVFEKVSKLSLNFQRFIRKFFVRFIRAIFLSEIDRAAAILAIFWPFEEGIEKGRSNKILWACKR